MSADEPESWGARVEPIARTRLRTRDPVRPRGEVFLSLGPYQARRLRRGRKEGKTKNRKQQGGPGARHAKAKISVRPLGPPGPHDQPKQDPKVPA